MIVLNKNCLQIATKTTFLKIFQVGLDGEFQIAMLSNLVSFLMCKCITVVIFEVVAIGSVKLGLLRIRKVQVPWPNQRF